jgi:hypothetical protein
MSHTFELHDTLTSREFQQHIPLLIDVPQGTTRMMLDFSYEPAMYDGFNNLVTLTIYDPNGWRGEGHKMEATQQVILGEGYATPGYLAGALPAGNWQVILNTHMVLERVNWRLVVTLDDAPQTEIMPRLTPGTVAARGRGWYRGDLHSHTLHSDGGWMAADLAAYAREQKLDFITLTDHNTTSGLREMAAAAGDDLLTLGGMELTTFFGHAVAFGVHQAVDWRVVGSGRTMTDALDDIEAAGGIFIIAHPYAPGNPLCTGCDWTYSELMPGKARFVEVWNYHWGGENDKNERGVRQWYDWMNAGYRMRATAGSDIHEQANHSDTFGRVVVFAEDLAFPAVLAALKAGHHYLSRGAHLELTTRTTDGTTVMMGDLLPAAGLMQAVWRDVPPGSELRWIVDGVVLATQPCAGEGSAELALDAGRWCVLELRRADGEMEALTNAIFFGDGWQ